MALISLDNIVKIFPDDPTKRRVLNGVSLSIAKGEFIAIMGPSGSGKSTLMNIIGLLDKPSEGVYHLDNENIDKKTKKKRLAYLRREKVGFVFQNFNLLSRMSAWRNVELPMVYSGVNARQQRAKELLTKVGLEHRMDANPEKLSGGEKQRVAIARALANKPALLLADEPTGNLDSARSKQIMDLLVALNKEGLTIVMVTHDDHVASFAHRIIRFADGKLVA